MAISNIKNTVLRRAIVILAFIPIFILSIFMGAYWGAKEWILDCNEGAKRAWEGE